MKWLLLAGIVIIFPTHGSNRYDVYRRCVACTNQCMQSEDKQACKQRCFQMKAQDCRQNGHGPGPRNTCSCT